LEAGRLRRLLPWAFRHKGWIGYSLLAFAGARLLEASVPLMMAEAIDRLAAGTFDVTGPVLAIAGAVLLRLVVVSSARIAIRRAAVNVAFDLRRALFDRLQRQGLTFFGQHTVGDMMTRAVSDIGVLRRLVSVGTIFMVILIYATTIGFGAMFYLAPDLAWLVFPPLPFIAVYALFAARSMRAASEATQETLGMVTERAQETFGGIRTLQAMAREPFVEARFGDANRAYIQAFLNQARINSLMTAIMPSLAAIGTLIVLGYGGSLVQQGALSPGSLVAFFAYVAMVIQPMRSAGTLVNMVQRGRVSAQRLFEILDLPDEIDDAGTHQAPRIDGALHFGAVTARYARAPQPALRDLELTIAPGEVIALMGPVGAGKSTLLALLPRLLEPSAGTITLDGVALADWPLMRLREALALVPQDAFLFADELGANLSYDQPDRPAPTILQAAGAAAFRQTVERLPEGLDTRVGERGLTLSGGQRQRATLTRGLIREAPVLLLDDCFAAVDTHTEAQILDGLFDARRGKTTIFVTHRSATAQRADRIAVLEDGALTALGTHAALAQGDGWYARLAKRQGTA
jgi:ATP-binding cassette subfamily B protein